MNTETKTMKPTVKEAVKALNLPTTYTVRKRVDGHIERDGNVEGVVLFLMHSGTGGHLAAYAMWTTQTQQWTEINKERFLKNALAVLGLDGQGSL